MNVFMDGSESRTPNHLYNQEHLDYRIEGVLGASYLESLSERHQAISYVKQRHTSTLNRRPNYYGQ
jgi:hypothetical protein